MMMRDYVSLRTRQTNMRNLSGATPLRKYYTTAILVSAYFMITRYSLRGLVCQRRPACATCVYLRVRMHMCVAGQVSNCRVLPSSMFRNITRCSHLDILLAEPVVRTNVKLCDARSTNATRERGLKF